jgi:uncharacterized FlaG/YvyC family protein
LSEAFFLKQGLNFNQHRKEGDVVMLVEPVSTAKVQTSGQPVVEPKAKALGQPPTKRQGGETDVRFLQQVVELAREHFSIRQIGLEFSVYGRSGKIKVTVFDKKTGQVIREVPSEQVLELMSKIEEMMGILFDKRA